MRKKKQTWGKEKKKPFNFVFPVTTTTPSSELLAVISDHVQLVPAPNIPLICVECQSDQNTSCFERLCRAGRYPGCFRLRRSSPTHPSNRKSEDKKTNQKIKNRNLKPQLLPIMQTHKPWKTLAAAELGDGAGFRHEPTAQMAAAIQ